MGKASQQFAQRESGRRRQAAPRFDPAFRARLLDLPVMAPRRTAVQARSLAGGYRWIGCWRPRACRLRSGLSEPWRFVLVDDAKRRAAIRACFETCNADALAMQARTRPRSTRGSARRSRRGAGADRRVLGPGTAQGAKLGRLTMPETLDYSVVTAVHTLWLAARAEGIGLGWVSILDPARMTAILEVPADWRFIGHLCLGYPQAEDDTPALERAGWEHRHPPEGVVIHR
ncbi:MAG: 5,6-dimethylbenzimidazole synthase [Hyphomicrobiales bacterium]